MSSPWAKIVIPEPINLEDIMSEEIAKDLLAKEVDKCIQEVKSSSSTSSTFKIPKEPLKQVSDYVYYEV